MVSSLEDSQERHPDKKRTSRLSQVTPPVTAGQVALPPRDINTAWPQGMRTMRNSGCPYCAGKKVLAGFNDLSTTELEIAAQWHPTLNGSLTPQMVTAGPTKRFADLRRGSCLEGYHLPRAGKQRRGCPVCAGVVNGKRRARYEKNAGRSKGGHVGFDCGTISAGLASIQMGCMYLSDLRSLPPEQRRYLAQKLDRLTPREEMSEVE